MAVPVYRLEEVWCGYPGRVVFQGLSLQLFPGRSYALVGPNGAGKSTLLRLLALLVRPDRGRLFFQGADLSGEADLVPWRRRLGHVAQQPVLVRGSVAANLELGLRFRGISRRSRQALVHQVAQEFGLHGLLTRPATELSGGEKQKVALARTLVCRPEVLLLDEPTAYLDPQASLEVEQILQHLRSPRALTLVLVTHDLEQAARLADEIILVRQGRLEQTRSPELRLASPCQDSSLV